MNHRPDHWFQSAEVYRALLEAAPDAIVVVDEKSTIILVNAQVEALFGYSRAEILGQPLEILLPLGARRQHQTQTEQYFKKPRKRPMGTQLELSARHKDGREIPVEISLSPLTTEYGTIVMSAIRDITERKQADQALHEARTELENKVKERTRALEARNEELDAFTHTVAHDLKNPLSLIIGMAGALYDSYTSLSNDELGRYLSAIVRDGRKMANIIDELLVLATVGQAEPDLEPLDMSRIVAEAIRRLEYKIKDNQAEILLPDRWPVALGHAPWIESVWVNYLSNAIKYGGQPPRVEFGASPQSNGHVKFWLRDNGQGLSAEEQAQLFRPFTRLHQVKHVEGYGMGLSIVHRIVSKLGGSVGVESQRGQGSTFFFTLPGQKPPQD